MAMYKYPLFVSVSVRTGRQRSIRTWRQSSSTISITTCEHNIIDNTIAALSAQNGDNGNAVRGHNFNTMVTEEEFHCHNRPENNNDNRRAVLSESEQNHCYNKRTAWSKLDNMVTTGEFHYNTKLGKQANTIM